MLVSHDCRFTFLKPGKTAGTSVELWLEPPCTPAGHVSCCQRTVRAEARRDALAIGAGHAALSTGAGRRARGLFARARRAFRGTGFHLDACRGLTTTARVVAPATADFDLLGHCRKASDPVERKSIVRRFPGDPGTMQR